MRLGVAPALATDGAVHLVKRLGCSSASGMVNAVLRKAVQSWRTTLERSSVDVQLSHPWWIYDRWMQSFGHDDTVRSMASAQERAVTWVWFADDATREELARQGLTVEPHPWCPGAWSAPGDPGRLIREVTAGAAYAQDPSSQLVAHAALALSIGRGSFADLCAAPGGKTALAVRHGAWRRVAACDIRPSRARLIRGLFGREDVVSIVVADATRPPLAPRCWDLVLLDAPCTGTGTFRRHPELKWRLTRASVAEMASLQRRLLLSAIDLAAPGGVVVYSTCSVESEENEDVVADLPDGVELEDLAAVLPAGVPWRATGAGGARILPNPDGDGFTMHAIRRRG
jgi:16S rRNA (cytosine967-C5)-methyltransferase